MKTITAQVNRLKELTGLNLIIDHNTHYGGYRLVQLKEGSSAHFGVFGESSCVTRRPNRQFSDYLAGLISGIEWANLNKDLQTDPA